MSQISPGVRVTVRGEDFIVTDNHGTNVIEAEGISELVQGIKFQFDLSLDEATVIAPDNTSLISDTSQNCRQTKLFIETTLRNSSFNSNAIELAHQTAIRGADYQFKGTLKALELPRPRVLIADAVGLGKTVQVGIFFTELIRRGKGKRILVVTPKSILAQFQQEIWARFSIPLVRLDSTGIARIKSEIPSNKNPFEYYDKVIVSIDTLKNNAKFRHYLEKTRWDILAIDECHTVANASSQRGDLAGFLSTKAEAMVLTSATPHNGQKANFANLMTMLEPTAIPFNGEFDKEDIQPYYVRRFKKDIEDEVGDAFRDRITQRLGCKLFAEEEDFLRAQQDFKKVAKEENEGSVIGTFLFSILLFKAYMSSPEACLETISRRLATDNDSGDVLEELRNMKSSLERIINEGKDAKYNRLKEQLENLKWKGKKGDNRIIIFAERIDTLKALEKKLTRDFGLNEKAVVTFTGALSDVEQQEVIEDFGKEDSDIRLFLTSDAGSQGVNLHYYCNHMFNYDVPWSIITLEQRNGRIDRFGQTETPYIYYLISESTDTDVQGDIRILEKLREKEQEVYKSLGDPGSVLKLYEPEKEEQKVTNAVANSDPSVLETEEDQVADFWAKMLDESNEDGKEEVPIDPGYHSFFKDDFSFYHMLKDEIVNQDPELAKRFDLDSDEQVLEITLDKELSRNSVLYDMPLEAFPDRRGTFKLTSNKEIIEKSIVKSRKKKGEWPEFHLLYDLHPIARWMQFKLLAKVDKGKALVVKHRTLPEKTAWFLFQGICSNNLGQSMLTEVFAIGMKLDGASLGKPLEYKAFFKQYKLDETITALPISDEEIKQLESIIPDAVEDAKMLYMDHKLDHLRHEKEEQLEEYKKQLEEWQLKANQQLELNFGEESGVIAWKKDQKQKEIIAISNEKSQYFKDLTSLQNEPFIRLMAVFFNN